MDGPIWPSRMCNVKASIAVAGSRRTGLRNQSWIGLPSRLRPSAQSQRPLQAHGLQQTAASQNSRQFRILTEEKLTNIQFGGRAREPNRFHLTLQASYLIPRQP